ncbi:tannase/feruloyl esterase family alpha/beta hydrolase [Spirillospora sp. CA-255316]
MGDRPLKRPKGRRRLPVAIACLLAVLSQTIGAGPSVADVSNAGGGASCADLTGLSLPDTKITSGELIPAGDYVDPEGRRHRDLPEFCRVTAAVAPSLRFEVWMPTTTWNDRFLGVGNGGFAGNISYPAMASALSAGYATASTDTGHSNGDSTNSWISNQAQLEMWGRTSIHLMGDVARERQRMLVREKQS